MGSDGAAIVRKQGRKAAAPAASSILTGRRLALTERAQVARIPTQIANSLLALRHRADARRTSARFAVRLIVAQLHGPTVSVLPTPNGEEPSQMAQSRGIRCRWAGPTRKDRGIISARFCSATTTEPPRHRFWRRASSRCAAPYRADDPDQQTRADEPLKCAAKFDEPRNSMPDGSEATTQGMEARSGWPSCTVQTIGRRSSVVGTFRPF